MLSGRAAVMAAVRKTETMLLFRCVLLEASRGGETVTRAVDEVQLQELSNFPLHNRHIFHPSFRK